MLKNFKLSIDVREHIAYVSRDDLEDELNRLNPFSFLVLDNGKAFMQVILDHDEFYNSVIEMRNYSETNCRHYQKIGLQLPEIITAFLYFYDHNMLPHASDWEDITQQIQ